MKKEELMAIGLTDEQIDKVFALNGRDVEKHKMGAEAAQSKITELSSQIAQREADIAELKKLDAAGLQARLEELQCKYETEKQEWEKKEQRKTYEDRRNDFFNGVEFSDNYAKRGVLTEFDEKEFKYSDIDKTFVGAKEWLDGLRESVPTVFKDNAGVPYIVKSTAANKAPEITKEMFAKMGYRERLALKKDSPEIYEQMKE